VPPCVSGAAMRERPGAGRMGSNLRRRQIPVEKNGFALTETGSKSKRMRSRREAPTDAEEDFA
jgi:hypothetical protein